MLRLLAIAPLLFATSLLAEEEDQLRMALTKRVVVAARVLELAKQQKVNPHQPSAVLRAGASGMSSLMGVW